MAHCYRYLGKTFGKPMMFIWAIGLFAAGQSSTMTGTYTGQFVMSGFLDMQVSPWMRAFITRSVALFPTLAFAIAYAGTNEMDTLNQDLNVLQSFQLPFALIPVLYVSSRDDIMGSFTTKGLFKWTVQAVGGILLLLNLSMAVVAAGQGVTKSIGLAVVIFISMVLYFLSVVYLMLGPVVVNAVLQRVDHAVAWRLFGWLARGRDKPGGEALVQVIPGSLDSRISHEEQRTALPAFLVTEIDSPLDEV
jgi:natural resistance-associated macrophage protein 2